MKSKLIRCWTWLRWEAPLPSLDGIDSVLKAVLFVLLSVLCWHSRHLPDAAVQALQAKSAFGSLNLILTAEHWSHAN